LRPGNHEIVSNAVSGCDIGPVSGDPDRR